LEDYEESNDRSKKRVLALIRNPKKLLATILLTNSFANIAFIISSFYFYETVLNNVSYPWLKWVMDTLVVTLIILIFGEVVPKVYATQNYQKTALFLSVPMQFFVAILTPFTQLMEKLGAYLERNTMQKKPNLTTEEINQAIDLTTDESTVETEQEKDILKGIVSMSQTSVKQIMISRLDVVALSLDADYHQVLQGVREHGYSRMPVYKDNLDQVKGILNVKSLLSHLHEGSDFPWQDLIYAPYFVPENKAIDDLLTEFQHKRIHIAVVVDEFGGTSGIVTLEDLLEEVFGELNDEFDDEVAEFDQLSDHVFLFEGKCLLIDFIRIMDLESDFFHDLELDSDTLAGFMTEMLGKIPKRGEKINLKPFQFIVDLADPKKIRKIKVIRNEN
jgi:putative hemolysin